MKVMKIIQDGKDNKNTAKYTVLYLHRKIFIIKFELWK